MSAGANQAWHMRAQSFRQVGSVLASTVVLPMLVGRRPFRCSRGRPYQKAQSRLFAGAGFPVEGLARDAMELQIGRAHV